MSLLDRLISLLAPHECLGCGQEGSLLCSDCACKLPRAEVPALPHLERIQAATLYEGLAKDLIWKLKSGGAQAAAQIMAESMAEFTPSASLIVPIPTATSRVRQRGYDQAKLLARALSSQTGLPYRSCLARHGTAHQVGAGRQQRLHQLANAFRVTRPRLIKHANVLLVDDVTTTGASLETAATVLKQAGAIHIEAVTFAYAEPIKLFQQQTS